MSWVFLVLLLAGFRAFAEQHAELLEGDLATLCSPRLGASVAGRALLRKAAGPCRYSFRGVCCTTDPRKVGRAPALADKERCIVWGVLDFNVRTHWMLPCPSHGMCRVHTSAGSTASRGTCCSAAVRRAREHMRSGQSRDDTWSSATSLLIAPPRLSRGFLSTSLEPLHLGFVSQTTSAAAGPWK